MKRPLTGGKTRFSLRTRQDLILQLLGGENTSDLTPAGPPAVGNRTFLGRNGATLARHPPTHAHTGSPDIWQEKGVRPGGRPAAGLGHLAGRGKTVPGEGPAGSSRARNRRAVRWKWLGRSHQERGRPHPQRSFQTRRGASTPAEGHPHLQKEGASSPQARGVYAHGGVLTATGPTRRS